MQKLKNRRFAPQYQPSFFDARFDEARRDGRDDAVPIASEPGGTGAGFFFERETGVSARNAHKSQIGAISIKSASAEFTGRPCPVTARTFSATTPA